MADVPGKPSAQSFSAGMATETGLSPLQWNDKCFLCSVEIGETEPRQFYQGTAAMMLCHSGCLNVMNTHGGKPADYHQAMSARQDPAAAPATPTWTVEAAGRSGPAWLDFPDMTALISYVRDRGDIPAHVKVTVAQAVVQAGE
jgi:hypothetical protein